MVVPRDGAGRAAVHGRRLHVFQKVLLALFIQIIEVKNGVRVIGRFLRYGYGIAVCRNNLRRGPVFLHFLDLLARVQNACLAPRGIARRGIDGKHRRASGIVTVMFVSGIVYVFDDALSAKAGRQKTTASMKTASRQPIKRMLFL